MGSSNKSQTAQAVFVICNNKTPTFTHIIVQGRTARGSVLISMTAGQYSQRQCINRRTARGSVLISMIVGQYSQRQCIKRRTARGSVLISMIAGQYSQR